MKKYAKMDEGTVVFLPRKIVIDGMEIHNPASVDGVPDRLGFKVFRGKEMPTEIMEGYCWASIYTETETEISQDWGLIENIE